MPKKLVRKKIPAVERLKLWVRSGGRCAICNRYLLEGKLSARELTFGEMAHVVGQARTKGSPRGLDALPMTERDKADNLMLVCADEHDEIDNRAVVDLFPVETLQKLKRDHENRILHVTGLGPSRRTTILRMLGYINGTPVELERDVAATTVVRSAQRFPLFDMAFDRHSIEVDLRGLPDEATGNAVYYEAAKRIIDRVVEDKLAVGIAQEEVDHLSVFGFARLPLLVYLGAKLDDNIKTDVYQRHRTPEGWTWPTTSRPTKFKIIEPTPKAPEAEAVLVMNISGAVQTSRIPSGVSALPRFVVEVDGADPSSDVIGSVEALVLFETTCRQLFASVEKRHPHVRRLHLFGALPVSAAVVLGRVLNPDVHPKLMTYHLADANYSPALEIG